MGSGSLAGTYISTHIRLVSYRPDARETSSNCVISRSEKDAKQQANAAPVLQSLEFLENAFGVGFFLWRGFAQVAVGLEDRSRIDFAQAQKRRGFLFRLE